MSLPNSAYAQELPKRFGRLRFDPAIESDFALSHLRRARGRIRVWHSMVLALLAFGILPVVLASRAGDHGLLPGSWNQTSIDLLLFVVALNTVARAMLVFVAWSPRFEQLYPRIAFPLVALCHGLWTFTCSAEILGSHPEYLAPLVTDAFAAYFFSGLLFRQAVVVNLIAVAGLLFGGWYHMAALAPIIPYGVHLLTNVVMAAVAGFAHERFARNLFLDHSLLVEMAARDGLTGLKNRRALDEHLKRVWQQSLRDRRMLGVLMIDVDQFKDYNDRYGHQAGDQALQRIARVVDGLARRPLDVAARYGGEELVVIVYDLSREYVVEIAERARRAVRGLAIEHEGSTTGIVTVSIGVAIVQPTLHRSPQGALQLADQALYDAKRDGRDRITVLEREYQSLTTGAFRRVRA